MFDPTVPPPPPLDQQPGFLVKMNVSSTQSWLCINSSSPVLPVVAGAGNRSGVEGYLQRLAHFDEGLYKDFYGLWIALVVVNSLIFLVGHSSSTVGGCEDPLSSFGPT